VDTQKLIFRPKLRDKSARNILAAKYIMTRSSRKSSRQTRRRMHGGANEACAAALRKVLPDESDHERMVEHDSNAIDTTQSYEEFVAYQMRRAEALSEANCTFLTGLCNGVHHMSCMDMEHCQTMGASNVFFDKKGKLVIANPR